MNSINQQEITMITTPRTCNTLTHADVYKLTRWIDKNQASLKGKTQDRIAQDASEGTGLKVTINNIQAVSKTLGIPFNYWAYMKHCKAMKQPCPNDPECKGCEALEQRNSDGSHPEVDMNACWRDYVCLLDIVGAVALIVVAGWASSYFYRG